MLVKMICFPTPAPAAQGDLELACDENGDLHFAVREDFFVDDEEVKQALSRRAEALLALIHPRLARRRTVWSKALAA